MVTIYAVRNSSRQRLGMLAGNASETFRLRPRMIGPGGELRLFDEAATARAEVLEGTIVALIVFEMVMAFAVG